MTVCIPAAVQQITRAKCPQQPHCIIHKLLGIEHGAATAAFLLVGSPDKSAKLFTLRLYAPWGCGALTHPRPGPLSHGSSIALTLLPSLILHLQAILRTLQDLLHT
jgi:hypothetical protein